MRKFGDVNKKIQIKNKNYKSKNPRLENIKSTRDTYYVYHTTLRRGSVNRNMYGCTSLLSHKAHFLGPNRNPRVRSEAYDQHAESNHNLVSTATRINQQRPIQQSKTTKGTRTITVKINIFHHCAQIDRNSLADRKFQVANRHFGTSNVTMKIKLEYCL